MKSTERQNALLALKNSEGWKIVLEWIESEKEAKEFNIFSVKADQNEKQYTEKDTLILERSYLMTLAALPDEIIRNLEFENAEIGTTSEIAVPSAT